MRYAGALVSNVRGFADRTKVLLLAAVLSFVVTSCGGYVARGRRLYHEGRYIESAEVLQRHEQDLNAEPPKRQAEYATYRGLSMLVLGNYPEAHRWMLQAYTIEQRHPGVMQPTWRRDLDQGWRQLQTHMQVQPQWLVVRPPPP